MAKTPQLNMKLLALFKAARWRVSRGHNDTCQLLVGGLVQHQLGGEPEPLYPCNCGHDALGEALEAIGQDQNTVDCTHKKG